MELRVFSYLSTLLFFVENGFKYFANTKICLIISGNTIYIFKCQTKYFSITIHKFAYDICTKMSRQKLIVAYNTNYKFYPLFK